MEVLLLTIPISLLLAAFFFKLFVWSVKNGQYDDLETQKNIIFNKAKVKGLSNDDK